MHQILDLGTGKEAGGLVIVDKPGTTPDPKLLLLEYLIFKKGHTT